MDWWRRGKYPHLPSFVFINPTNRLFLVALHLLDHDHLVSLKLASMEHLLSLRCLCVIKTLSATKIWNKSASVAPWANPPSEVVDFHSGSKASLKWQLGIVKQWPPQVPCSFFILKPWVCYGIFIQNAASGGHLVTCCSWSVVLDFWEMVEWLIKQIYEKKLYCSCRSNTAIHKISREDLYNAEKTKTNSS